MSGGGYGDHYLVGGLDAAWEKNSANLFYRRSRDLVVYFVRKILRNNRESDTSIVIDRGLSRTVIIIRLIVF